MVDLIERIDVLLFQENAYMTCDYIKEAYQHRLDAVNEAEANVAESSSNTTSGSSSSASGINEFWREKICEWAYQVVDHFDLSREVVSVATNYLDRFLAIRLVDKKVFQICAMVSLSLAIKLYEPGRISMASMIELSRGYFNVEQMKEMELVLLRTLRWRVHPPTAFCFAKHFLFLMPYTSISMDARHDTLELARFFTELAVIDYFFVSKKTSSVALAALLNSVKEIPDISSEAQMHFTHALENIHGLNLQSTEVLECQERLQRLYAQGGFAKPEATTSEETRIETVSPVCVSYGISAPCVEDVSQRDRPNHAKARTSDLSAVTSNMARSSV